MSNFFTTKPSSDDVKANVDRARASFTEWRKHKQSHPAIVKHEYRGGVAQNGFPTTPGWFAMTMDRANVYGPFDDVSQLQTQLKILDGGPKLYIFQQTDDIISGYPDPEDS